MALLQETTIAGDIVVAGEVIETGAIPPSGTIDLASTDELPEGSNNLYYTDTRVSNFLVANGYFTDLTGFDTDDLTEGNNLYFTAGRVHNSLAAGDGINFSIVSDVLTIDGYTSTNFDADFAGKDTDDLTEGTTNRYYNSSLFEADFASQTTDDLIEGSGNLYFENERVHNALAAGNFITFSVSGGVLTIDGEPGYTSSDFDNDFATKSTDELSEGANNLYFTDPRAVTAIEAEASLNLNSVDTTDLTTNEVSVGGLTVSDKSLDVSELNADLQITTNGGDVEVGTSILPDVDDTHDLGSPTQQWGSVYVGPGSVFVGGTQALFVDNGELTLNVDKVVATGIESTSVEFNTDEVEEGNSNLYFTEARVHSSLSAAGDLNYDGSGEFSVTTYKSGDFDNDFAGKSTSDLSEGSNLYFTDQRVLDTLQSAAAVTIGGDFTVDGSTTIINSTQVDIGDNILVLNAGETGTPSQDAGIEIERGTSTNAQLLWNEGANTWTAGIAGSLSTIAFLGDDLSNFNIDLDTDDIPEGSNLYFTQSRARNSVSASGDLSYDSSSGVFSVTTYKSSDFDSDFAGKSTSNLSEGSNLYFTNARAVSAIKADGDWNASNWDTAYDRSPTGLTVSASGRTVSITLNRENASNLSSSNSFGQFGTGDVDFANQSLNTGSSPTFNNLDLSGNITVDNNEFRRVQVNRENESVEMTARSIIGRVNGSIDTRLDIQDGLWDFQNGDVRIINDLDVTGNVTGGNLNISNWNTAYDRSVTGVSGSGNGTLTISRQGSNISTSLAHSHGFADLPISSTDVSNWDTAYNRSVTGVSFSGSGNGSATITVNRQGTNTSDSTSLAHSHGFGDLPISSTDVSNWDTAYDDSVTGVSISGGGNSSISVTVSLRNSSNVSNSTSTSHNHSAGDITSGTLSTARLPTITTSEVNFTNQSLDTGATVRFNRVGISRTVATGYDLDVNGDARVRGDLDVDGDVTAFFSSDMNLKNNVTSIESAISKVSQLGGYEFDWKEGFKQTGKSYGLIAQEVEKVFPELVREHPNGHKQVDYVKIIPTLVEAIKEQQQEIQTLKAAL